MNESDQDLATAPLNQTPSSSYWVVSIISLYISVLVRYPTSKALNGTPGAKDKLSLKAYLRKFQQIGFKITGYKLR